MGSLTSSPKPLPVAQPQVITVEAAPVAAAASAAESASSAASTTAATETDAQEEASARAAELQEQSRGLLSTVNTGFNGVLSDTPIAQGKSLLGE